MSRLLYCKPGCTQSASGESAPKQQFHTARQHHEQSWNETVVRGVREQQPIVLMQRQHPPFPTRRSDTSGVS